MSSNLQVVLVGNGVIYKVKSPHRSASRRPPRGRDRTAHSGRRGGADATAPPSGVRRSVMHAWRAALRRALCALFTRGPARCGRLGRMGPRASSWRERDPAASCGSNVPKLARAVQSRPLSARCLVSGSRPPIGGLTPPRRRPAYGVRRTAIRRVRPSDDGCASASTALAFLDGLQFRVSLLIQVKGRAPRARHRYSALSVLAKLLRRTLRSFRRVQASTYRSLKSR